MAIWHLYCDESGTNSNYLVLGGVLLKSEDAQDLVSRIDQWRALNNISGEVSWKKTAPQSLERHKQFAQGTLRHARDGRLAFRSAVFNRRDNELFRGVKRAERYEKLLYQFLLHCFALRIPVGDSLAIFPDHQFLPGPPGDMAERLNYRLHSKHGGNAHCVQRIEPTDSKKCHFIQMADLLAGVIAAANNQDFDPLSNRGAPKRELIDHVAGLSGHFDFSESTPKNRLDFKVWHFVPHKKKRSPVALSARMHLDVAKGFGAK